MMVQNGRKLAGKLGQGLFVPLVIQKRTATPLSFRKVTDPHHESLVLVDPHRFELSSDFCQDLYLRPPPLRKRKAAHSGVAPSYASNLW